MLADDLLRGPRGRRLCWEATGLASFRVAHVPDSAIAESASRAAEELIADDAAAGRRIFQALRESAHWAMYWQEPDECDHEMADPEFAETLRPVAEAVAGSAHAAWWTTGADLAAQQHVVLPLEYGEPIESSPELTGAGGTLAAWRAGVDEQNASMRRYRASYGYAAPDAVTNVSGVWWSTPNQFPIRSTTRSLAPFGPVGLWLVEDWPGFRRMATWPVRPLRPPRIFEITDWDAWRDLVLRHPVDVSDARGADWQRVTGRVGTWLIPDWQAVAAEYDAVHLTVLGYLTSAGRTIAVESNTASVIAGWAPDTTYWLADILEIAGPPTHWVEDEGWHSVPSLEG